MCQRPPAIPVRGAGREEPVQIGWPPHLCEGGGLHRGGVHHESFQLVWSEAAVGAELPRIGDGLAAGRGRADEDGVPGAAQREQVLAVHGSERMPDDARHLGGVVRVGKLEPPLSAQRHMTVLAANEDEARDRALRAALEEPGMASAQLGLTARLLRFGRVEMGDVAGGYDEERAVGADPFRLRRVERPREMARPRQRDLAEGTRQRA